MDGQFNINCSDEEYADCKGPWEPPLDENYAVYSILAKGELPKLHWKSPGYKSETLEIKTPPEKIKEIKPEENKSAFDFLEFNLPTLEKDGEDALRGSAKKKSSFDGVTQSVISNLIKRRSLQLQEKDS